MARVEEDDDCFVEPFFYDEARDLANRARAMEMSRREEEEMARQEEEKARKAEENRRRGLDHERVMESIVEYDPKTERQVYTRYPFDDFDVFDINEESPIPSMRYTERYINGLRLQDSANILSFKIVSLDKGFPINVYGTIIARDSTDHKCIYLFNRHRENCQPINSMDDSFILTGPGRGLVLLDFIYLEIDLKVKASEELLGEQISKGLLMIDGRVLARDEKVDVGCQTVESWLSTVEVNYATILNAVEATFEIKLLKGRFSGNIILGIKGIEPMIVIYNTDEDGAVSCGDRSTVIKLRRRVITICPGRTLAFDFNVCCCVGAAMSMQKVEFRPRRRGEEAAEISCDGCKLQVKAFWSMMDFRP